MNEIDDLHDIENSGQLKDDLTISNIYNVKIGGFGKSEFVKTYLTTLTVDELEQDISIYETLSRDKTWPVSQIIQREVDKLRVSDISKDYVLRNRAVKYFPPIIIAILPKNIDETIALELDYSKVDSEQIKDYIFEKSNYRKNEKLKKFFTTAKDLSIINGFYLLQVSEIFDFNILCWDKSKYYAIVIDGQHRLESLIHSKKQDPEIKNYKQDVVFVEFSQLINQTPADKPKPSPVDIVRRVFVDINTNAKRVGLVRQILMDDKDLASLLVQSLVDSVTKDGVTKNEDKYLKSQLVDWYGESLKHNLPHITGILALQQIISDYLLDGNMSSIDNLRNPNRVKKWVRVLNEFFFVDKTIEKDNANYSNVTTLDTSLTKYNNSRSLDEEIDDDDIDFKETTLFSYDYRVLEIAQDSFEALYLSSIVMFFNEFKPYKEAYKIVEANKGFEHRSTTYKALLSSRKKISETKVLKDAIAELKSELEDALNERYYILFSVLGQKTLFNILFKRIFETFNQTYTESTIKAISKKFIDEVNHLARQEKSISGYIFGKKELFVLNNIDNSLLDLGTIASQFWEGIIYENNRIIYNSQGIKSFTSVIEYMINLENAIKNNSEYPVFGDVLFMRSRIKRILKKTFNSYSASEIDNYVEIIIEKKEEFIIDVIKQFKN